MMWQVDLQQFWSINTLYCLILANPYCSDDAFGYHLYNDLQANLPRVSDNLQIFFSYNINVEEILLKLDTQRSDNVVVMLLDTYHQPSEKKNSSPLFSLEITNQSNLSTHKAEWSIIKELCKKRRISVGVLLISVKYVDFIGKIKPLSTELQKINNQLLNFFLK